MSGPDVDALVEKLASACDDAQHSYDDWRSGERFTAEAHAALDSLAALARSAADMEEALEGIERYAYDAICDGHPSIPEMTRVQQRAMGALAAARSREQQDGDEWFVPEGDRTCGVVHRLARATCMKRSGHEGSHATPQGTWIDGPWCEYPAREQQEPQA